VISDDERKIAVEAPELPHVDQFSFKVFHLATQVKYQQAEQVIHAGVRRDGHHQQESLRRVCKLEIWALVLVVKVIGLQRQDLLRVGNVRYISQRCPEKG